MQPMKRPSRLEVPLVLALWLVFGAALATVTFWFFLPVYDAQVIPQSSWSARIWLPSWT